MPKGSIPGGVPRDVRVATPDTWFDLDLDPKTSARSIAWLVEERAGRNGKQVPTRWQLTAMLEKATADARSHGAIFASVFSDVIEHRPVAALLIISLANDHAVVAGAGETRAQAIAGVLGRPGGPADGAEIRVVELPAGWAVRSRYRAAVDPEGLEGYPVEVENLQYFTLIPSTTNLLLLSFATPNVGVADAMVELFDGVAESMRWWW
jgi:hypothetical protein